MVVENKTLIELNLIERNLIKYWLTACWDMQRTEGTCRKCLLQSICRRLRTKLWEKDPLKQKRFQIIVPIEAEKQFYIS